MSLADLQARLAAMPAEVLARASEGAATRLQERMRTGTATPEAAGVTLDVHIADPYLSDEWRQDIDDAIGEAEAGA